MAFEILSIAFMFIGAIFLLAGSIGLIRLKDTYSRLHALTKADVLGFGFIVLSCILSTDLLSHWIKLLLVDANCYMVVYEGVKEIRAGQEVDILPFDW